MIRSVDQDIPVIDLTHGIPPQDVRAGAIALADAVPFLPHRTVVLAVVDPGVGARGARSPSSQRRHSFVGPDNGLLAPAIAKSGGADSRASSSRPRRGGSSRSQRTFHGRDLFAPVAARLAKGQSMAVAGQPLDPQVLVGVQLPQAQIGPGQIVAEVIEVDIYGNIRLAAPAPTWRRPGCRPAPRSRSKLPGCACRPSWSAPSTTSRPTSRWSTKIPTDRWRSPSTAATRPNS